MKKKHTKIKFLQRCPKRACQIKNISLLLIMSYANLFLSDYSFQKDLLARLKFQLGTNSNTRFMHRYHKSKNFETKSQYIQLPE